MNSTSSFNKSEDDPSKNFEKNALPWSIQIKNSNQEKNNNYATYRTNETKFKVVSNN